MATTNVENERSSDAAVFGELERLPDTQQDQAVAFAPSLGYSTPGELAVHMAAMFDDECQGINMATEFDDEQWRLECKRMAVHANQCTGLVYELYERRICAAVDGELRKLPEPHRAQAIEIARSFGYVTPQELAAAKAAEVDDDYCGHGFPPNCCPLGCDDVD